MLYVTTRSNRDAFTAQRVLCENRAPDGGLYVPFRDPPFSAEEIEALKDQPFSKCVADVLNKLFHARLSSWDVEFAIGRYPVRLKKINQRIIVGECWRNLDSDISHMIKNLTDLARADKKTGIAYGDWAGVGVRIAVLFGFFAELMRSGIADQKNPVDVSVVSGDFSAPISAWYARRWGLPIGNIICCCNENGNLWDFICHGQLRTDGVAKKTATPEADVIVPVGLERLIHAFGGQEEVLRYVDAVRRGSSYYIDDKMLHSLRQGIYVTVNSERRILSTIPAVYATHRYLLSPYSALIYAGLQDYRSRTGENRTALIIADKSPICDAATVASVMGISADEVKKLVD